MRRLVPDAPRAVVRRGWRRGLPVAALNLAALAVVHAMLLPDVDRMGEAGDLALERWLEACAVTGGATTLVWMALCLRIELGSNRWVEPPRRSGWLPVPDPATGCLTVLMAVVALCLATLVELLAVAGPADAVALTGVTLVVQLGGVVVTVGAVLWVVMPAVGIAAGLARRGPADGGDARPTGPRLVVAGVVAYVGLAAVVALVVALLNA